MKAVLIILCVLCSIFIGVLTICTLIVGKRGGEMMIKEGESKEKE
jgi:hypothetical protein